MFNPTIGHATRDLSDVTDGKILLNAHLPELYAFHQDRLAAQPVSLRVFEKTRAAQMIESFAAMKATRLKELGLARFTNPEQTVWCYSVRRRLARVHLPSKGPKMKPCSRLSGNANSSVPGDV